MADKPYPLQTGLRLCPHCVDQKLKSKVTCAAPDTRTSNPAPSGSWDESGVYIPPAMVNTLTCSFSCSQGHRWQEQSPCY